MGIEEYDDGSLDDLYLTLVERAEGQIIDGTAVTRAEVLVLFDELIASAERYIDLKKGATVRRTLEWVIRSFTHERLMQHMRDLRRDQ